MICERYPAQTWKDFLIDHAADGHPDAVVILRRSYRSRPKNLRRAFLGTDEGQILLPLEKQIRPNGDVLYQAPGVNVRDTGERLELDSSSAKGMAEVLRMARLKFGDHIQVSGDMPFKAAVVEAAIDTEQPVTFADPGMEKRRRVLYSVKHPPRQRRRKRRAGDLGGHPVAGGSATMAMILDAEIKGILDYPQKRCISL